MEPLLLSLFLIPFLVCLSSLYYLFIFSSSKNKSAVDPSKYPPGNTGWPVIGESIEFFNTQKFIQERMNKYSNNIFKTSVVGKSVAVLCGLEGNKFLFSNENKFVVSWWPQPIQKLLPFTSNKVSLKAETIKVRKVLSQFLMPEPRQRCIAIIDRVVLQHLVTNWDNKSKVTITPLAKNYSLCLGCQLYLSIDDLAGIEEIGEPLKQLKDAIFALPVDLPGTTYRLASKLILNKLVLIVKKRKIDLMEKKALFTQDVLSHMLSEVDDDGNLMDESDMASKILGLLIGIDTTSYVITFIIKYLAELPGVYSEVQKELKEIECSKGPGELLNWDDIQKMKYSWNVACEVMRLVPPCQGTFREAIADFNYKGYSVPRLFWSQHSTHQNSDYFSEPEKFDPTRFEGEGPVPYTYVPFGGGPHICPGKEIAKLQILVFMYHVVRKYKWETVLPDEKIILYPFPRLFDGLPVLLHPKIASSKTESSQLSSSK
ncbi:hypothetical protein MKW92_014112 [Papaver armeniacum]|nr:hypothetical protein MKW92_014112 [Papaver armeniacum]